MLGKLIKYDLKWVFNIVIFVYYGIGLFFSITGRLLELLPDSIFFSTLLKICKGIALSTLITGLVNCMIRLWVRFTINMYKDESYLTHTTPIKTTTHYISKVLNTIIVTVISVVVIFVGIFIMYYSKSNMEVLRNLINTLGEAYNVNMGLFIILLLLTLFLEIVFIVLVGYFGTIMGYSYNNSKLGKTFIFAIATYLILNIITLSIALISSIFNSEMHSIIFTGNTVVSYQLFITILIVNICLFIIYKVIIFILSYYKLNKGINIE